MKTDPPTSPSDQPASHSQPAADAPKLHQRPRGKVFDVMRPGRAPASPTSRPVVIGHKPKAQAAQASVSGIGEADKADTMDPHKKITLSPAHGDVGAEPAPTGFAARPEPSVPVPGAQPTPVTPAAASKPEDQEKEDKFAEAAMEPEPPTPAATSEQHAPLPQEEAPQEGDPIVGVGPPSLDGQVVVSHHTTAPAGTGKLIGLIILMLVFVLIVLNILLDAGVISSSAIPHTNLF